MRKIDITLNVGEAVSLPGRHHVTATVFLPKPETLPARPIVVFAAPGGGYARGYYDLHFAQHFSGHLDYSQAEHHTARGIVFVAYDHLGVGDSSTAGLGEMTIETIAAANDAAVREILALLVSGSLSTDLPALDRPVTIGMGQSMGGGVSIIMQGRHRSFDAIAPLGYSAIHTVLPQPTQEALARGKAIFQYDRTTRADRLSVEQTSAEVPDFLYPFHWEDVPKEIIAADIANGFPMRRTPVPWGSATVPPCVVAMMGPGYVAEDAAAVTVPVFLGFGARDVSEHPLNEPSAFKRARDVSVFVVPSMAHMHNFASTRRLLWDRLAAWMDMVAGTAGTLP